MNKIYLLAGLTLLLAPALSFAVPPRCPAVIAVKNATLTSNTHDNYGTWNLFGATGNWVVLIGNIKADNLDTATSIAKQALAGLTTVSGPFVSQQHWVCKYTPEPTDGYYVVAWNAVPM